MKNEKKEKGSSLSPLALACIWSLSAVCWITATVTDFLRDDPLLFMTVLHIVCAVLSILNAVIQFLNNAKRNK